MDPEKSRRGLNGLFCVGVSEEASLKEESQRHGWSEKSSQIRLEEFASRIH
jgi:hypothetical protein